MFSLVLNYLKMGYFLEINFQTTKVEAMSKG